jgi:hypothetical protein
LKGIKLDDGRINDYVDIISYLRTWNEFSYNPTVVKADGPTYTFYRRTSRGGEIAVSITGYTNRTNPRDDDLRDAMVKFSELKKSFKFFEKNVSKLSLLQSLLPQRR